jgi:hypothetical protein
LDDRLFDKGGAHVNRTSRPDRSDLSTGAMLQDHADMARFVLAAMAAVAARR